MNQGRGIYPNLRSHSVRLVARFNRVAGFFSGVRTKMAACWSSQMNACTVKLDSSYIFIMRFAILELLLKSKVMGCHLLISLNERKKYWMLRSLNKTSGLCISARLLVILLVRLSNQFDIAPVSLH